MYQRAHKVRAIEYSGKDQRFNQVFNNAMRNQTTIFMSKMLEGYKRFNQTNRVVDVGGGFRVFPSMITSKYPHIKAINFDLPYVIQNAPSYPGVDHVGETCLIVPSDGDTIFMKRATKLVDGSVSCDLKSQPNACKDN